MLMKRFGHGLRHRWSWESAPLPGPNFFADRSITQPLSWLPEFFQVQSHFSHVMQSCHQNCLNQTGRRSRSLADCMIGAVAIRCGAKLATINASDFHPFLPFGLILAD